MTTTRGLSWDEGKKGGKTVPLIAGLALIASLFAAGPAPARALEDPASVWSASGWESSATLLAVETQTYPGSLYEITRSIGSREAWGNGATGAGIDVAVIDTGVAPVAGLTGAGKVINGADLSFESQSDTFSYLDTYGHGTHMAGIIAGLDPGVADYSAASPDRFVGVAPEAGIVNIKVGAHDGSVDVSQVIAAVDWVIQHKDDDGMNIRVLNLSYGTDSTQSYLVDPLAKVVEKAWQAGIVVVTAAGNDGNAAPLRNPAHDPFVIAVGSAQAGEYNTTSDAQVTYDRVSTYSNCGVVRTVDLVAPGKSIRSLRVPGSMADETFPEARVDDRFFLGSGTSQAAAVVSGAVALVLSSDPSLTPDQVKDLLTSNATPMSNVSATCQGAGVVNTSFLGSRFRGRNTTQAFTASSGAGSLELSRGSFHLVMDGMELRGEQDIMGSPWKGFVTEATICSTEGKGKNATTVCEVAQVEADTLWDGGDWNGTSWSGTSWSGTSWSGTSWSGTSWSGTSWSGTSWSGTSWSDKFWSGTSWSGTSWSGTSWSGTSWSGTSWSDTGWSGGSWG
jgi:serine protease AprX